MDSESSYYPLRENQNQQQQYMFSSPGTPGGSQFGGSQFPSQFQNQFSSGGSQFANQFSPGQFESSYPSPPIPPAGGGGGSGGANPPLNMKSFILPPSDPKSPFHSDLPSQKPIPKLVKRLQAWIKVIHSLVTYFKMLQISCSQISKIHLTMCESVDFPMFDNGDSSGFDYRAALKLPSDIRDLINSTPSGDPENDVTGPASSSFAGSPSMAGGSVANSSFGGASSTVSGSYFNSGSNNNAGVPQSGKPSPAGKATKGAIRRHNFCKDKEANENFLPLGSHSIQDLPTLLILYHKNISLINLNFSHELSKMIIPRLEELKKDLTVKIKEIKALSDDFKNGLKQDIAITGQKLYDYLDSLQQETATISPTSNLPGHSNAGNSNISGKFKRDPFVLKFKLDYQLRNQFIQENFLQEAYINIQTTASQLEKIIAEEIKRSLNSLTFVIDNEIKLKYEVMINGLLKDGYSQKPYYQEWNSFVENDNNCSLLKSVQVGAPLPKVRKISDVEYPYKNSFLSKCIKTGYMEKKMKILKTYRKCFYLLTVNGLYEFNSMNDFQLSRSAPTASYPLDCCSLGVFDYSKNRFVMQYSKRPQASSSTPVGGTAWSPSINYNNGNADPEAIFNLESEPNPFEKSLKIKNIVKDVQNVAETVIDEPLSVAEEAISATNNDNDYFGNVSPGSDGRSPGAEAIGALSGNRIPSVTTPVSGTSSGGVGNAPPGAGSNGNEVVKITFKMDDQKEILMWYKYLKSMFQYDTCYERAMHIERMYLKKKREEERVKEAKDYEKQMQREQEEEEQQQHKMEGSNSPDENLINNEDKNTYINFDGTSSDTSSSNNNNNFNMFKDNNNTNTNNNNNNNTINNSEVKQRLLNPYNDDDVQDDSNSDGKDANNSFITGIAPEIVIMSDDNIDSNNYNSGSESGMSPSPYYFEEQEVNNNSTMPGSPSSGLVGSGSTLNLIGGGGVNSSNSVSSKMYKLGNNGSGMLSGLRPKMRFTTSSPNILNNLNAKKGAVSDSGVGSVTVGGGAGVPSKMMNSGNPDVAFRPIGNSNAIRPTMTSIPTITHSNEHGEEITEATRAATGARRPTMERSASSSRLSPTTSTPSSQRRKTGHVRHSSGVSLKLGGVGGDGEMKALRSGLAGLKLSLRSSKKDKKKS